MKIRKMSAHFGALDGDSLQLSEGLNILYAPNESGKSTWCAFLRAMLYGVSSAQRARGGQKPDKVKYRPWSGTPMSGSMDLVTPDGYVTLRRWTERDDRPMQCFSATVTGTELPVPALTAETAGETLTGMPAAVFERSVFIRQSGMELTSDPALEKRIGAIVASGDEEISYSEADKRLRSWQRRRRSGSRGAIPELEREMAQTERVLNEIKAHGEAAAAAEEEIAALERRCTETETAMHEARARQRRQSLAEMAAARQPTKEAEAACEKARQALSRADAPLMETPFGTEGPEEAAGRVGRDLARAEELAASVQRKSRAKLAFLLPVLAVLALLAAVFLPWKVELVIAGCLFLLLFAAAFMRAQGQKKEAERALDERAALLRAYGAESPEEVEALLERYKLLWSERERIAASAEEAESTLQQRRFEQHAAEERALRLLDFTDGDNDAARAARQLSQMRARIGELKERRAMEEGQAKALGDRAALESGLSEARGRYDELLFQEQALALAEETLTRADAELQERLSPVLARRAAEYYALLTGGRYDEVTLARDLSACARLAGDDTSRELDYLSAGAKDQLYLALRLAVCDLALPGDDPCPLVLDDALVAFDRERMALALDLMKRIAEDRQVLLFTCHTRESEYFARDAAVTKIKLTDGSLGKKRA